MKEPNRMSCEEVFRRLDDFVDRELGPGERQLVEEHLESCAACAAEYRFEESVVEEVRAKLRRVRVPQRLRANVMARLRQARLGEAGPGH